MAAGNLEDTDLKYILTLLGTSAQDAAIKAKIEADLPAPPPPPPPVVVGVEIALSADKTGAEVTALPPGASGADFAFCTEPKGTGPVYPPGAKDIQVGQSVKPPDTTHVYADAIARNAQGSTVGLGGWYSTRHAGQRIHVEGSVPPPPPPEEPPVEPPPTSTLRVGMVSGGWGGQEITDAVAGKQNAARLENPSDISAFKAKNLDVLWLANHYSTGGIKSVNRSDILNRVRVADAAGAWVIEVENEPGGDWFWGANALSEANAKAMGEILLEAHTAAPNAKLLASWDGGHAGGGEWGKLVLKTTPALKGAGWLRWSVHCYAGSGADPSKTSISPCAGLCVHLPTIDAAHAATGCNVIPSELGFPTLSSTGDSPKCTEAQQKLAHELSLRYCRERPYVEGYFAYGYRDGSGAKGYGLVRSDDSKKPAFSVVHP